MRCLWGGWRGRGGGGVCGRGMRLKIDGSEALDTAIKEARGYWKGTMGKRQKSR